MVLLLRLNYLKPGVMVKYVTLGSKNKFKTCLNAEKYQLFRRDGGEMSSAGSGDSGPPTLQQTSPSPVDGTHLSGFHTRREAGLDVCIWGLFSSVKSNSASEGQRIPGHVLNTLSVPPEGFRS